METVYVDRVAEEPLRRIQILESNDPDAIPTLDEESLDPKEMELLEHWARNSPQMAKQFKRRASTAPSR